MTTQKLQITKQELKQIMRGGLDERFEEIFNDIPLYHPDHVWQKGETHYQYCEDDGRMYKWYIFKDKVTDIEHCINYTYHPDWDDEFMDFPDSIEIVDESVLFPKEDPIPEPEKVLSPEELADKTLWNKYLIVEPECSIVVPKEKIKVPSATIKEILRFLKEDNPNIYQIRAVVIPVCIEYKLEQVSFWKWLQVKRKVWKA